MTDNAREKPDHPTRSSEAFFGRRKGLKLNAGQAKLFETLLPELKLDLATSCASPDCVKALFANSPDRIQMEIGFGGAEHLINQANLFPNTGFIGVEPFVNGMAKALASIHKQDIGHIRLYDDDATQVLDWLPEQSIDQIDLMYPDPWPKKRHWKRRFVSEKNLNRIGRVLKNDGIFRFASDIDTYVNWTLRHCHNSPHFDWVANCADDWHSPFENWIETRYERKARREGRSSAYLTFKRQSRP